MGVSSKTNYIQNIADESGLLWISAELAKLLSPPCLHILMQLASVAEYHRPFIRARQTLDDIEFDCTDVKIDVNAALGRLLDLDIIRRSHRGYTLLVDASNWTDGRLIQTSELSQLHNHAAFLPVGKLEGLSPKDLVVFEAFMVARERLGKKIVNLFDIDTSSLGFMVSTEDSMNRLVEKGWCRTKNGKYALAISVITKRK